MRLFADQCDRAREFCSPKILYGKMAPKGGADNNNRFHAQSRHALDDEASVSTAFDQSIAHRGGGRHDAIARGKLFAIEGKAERGFGKHLRSLVVSRIASRKARLDLRAR